MSTRANVIIKDEHTSLFFYRHSDGYPSVTGNDLLEFVSGYAKHMRNCPGQSAGWLIVKGHKSFEQFSGYDWKVGNYEPTDKLHSDVEYVYIIDLEKGLLSCRIPANGFWDSPDLEHTKPGIAGFPDHKFKMT